MKQVVKVNCVKSEIAQNVLMRETEISEQFYKGSTIVNYKCRIAVQIIILLVPLQSRELRSYGVYMTSHRCTSLETVDVFDIGYYLGNCMFIRDYVNE